MIDRWWLDYVPWCMRSLPWIRRYYWQQWEIDEAKRWADEMRRFFGWD